MIDWAAFKRARSYLSGERWRMAAAAGCAVLSSLCYVALVLILGLIAELVFQPNSGLARFSGSVARHVAWIFLAPAAQGPERHRLLENAPFCLAVLLAAALGLAAVRAACQYLQSWLAATAVADAMHRMRRAIYRQ